jgi:hypothetical protein
MLSKIRKDTQCLYDAEETQDEESSNATPWVTATRRKPKPLREIMEETMRETGKQVRSVAINENELEVKLREERRKNVIIHGVDEPSGSKTECDENDRIFINGLSTEIEVEMEDIRQLGIKTEGKTRPIHIQWKDEANKEAFMKQLVNLINSESR